jgi:hypothetical protein
MAQRGGVFRGPFFAPPAPSPLATLSKVAAAGPVTGTLGVTLDPFTTTTVGQVLIQATLGQTMAAFTLTGQSNVVITGTLGVTMAPFTLAGNSNLGAAANNGQLAQTVAAFTLSATGALLVQGSLSATLAPFTLSAASNLPITGIQGPTVPAFTLLATGTVSQAAITGTLNVTFANFTLDTAPTGARLPYWGPPSRGRGKPSGAHIPEKELRRAVRELLAIEAAKAPKERKKPSALAKALVAKVAPMAGLGVVAKRGVELLVAEALPVEAPEYFAPEMIYDKEAFQKAILHLLQQAIERWWQVQVLKQADDDEDEEAVAILLMS